METNSTILVGPHFEHFISNEVSSGRYNSASEVVRAALRLLETEEEKSRLLNKALIEGEESGFVDHFDTEVHLKNLQTRIA